MDKNLIEKYKQELLNTYSKRNGNNRSKAVAVIPQTESVPGSPSEKKGELIVIVTAIRSLYPIENAQVIVFSEENGKRQNLKTAYTDQSGKTAPISLAAPDKELSLESENKIKPYSEYNIEVKAEGYIDSIYMGIPIFDGITSLQQANMLLLETAGEDKGPIIYTTPQNTNL